MDVVFLLTYLHLVVVTGKQRPTQQEFNRLATSLGISGQAVSGLYDMKPFKI